MNKQLRFNLGSGEIPLLTKCQLQILDEVHEVLEAEIDKHLPSANSENDLFDITLQISCLERYLEIIMKHLKMGRAAKLRFTETYPKWSKNREECIGQLHEIAYSINTDRFNCNVSKLVGYCASFIGGAITLASAIAIPFTFGFTTPLAVAGGTITAAGCGTAIGTSITEIVLLKKKVANAKMFIEKDKIYFEEMKEWLNNASELQESLTAVSKTLSSILGPDILKDITDNIQSFIKKITEIKNDILRLKFIERRLSQIVNKFVRRLAHKQLPVVYLKTVLEVLATIYLVLLNTENRLVFDCTSLTIKSILGIASLVDSSMDVFHLSSFFAGNSTVAKSFARAVTRGAVAAVAMALDVIAIVITSVDVHKGSLSPEAQKINEAAEILGEEAVVLQRVYRSLFQPVE